MDAIVMNRKFSWYFDARMRVQFAGAFALMGFAAAIHAGTEEDVAAVIDAYRIYEESGDMIAQGRLMTDDRAMMYVGGVLTGDNRRLMREQQKAQDEYEAMFPGVVYRIEIRDLKIQTWNDATALATFHWHPERVIPLDLPAATARQLGPPKTSVIMALVLVRQENGWKIAFTSFVPPEDRDPPSGAREATVSPSGFTVLE